MIVFCLLLSCCTHRLPLTEFGRRDKEKIEIAYIRDCVKSNKSVDSLIEWELTSRDDKMISFKYKSYLAYFIINVDKEEIFLKEIDYYHNSFNKNIFTSDSQKRYEVASNTTYKVWMSIDSLSKYFCIIHQGNIMIWVLTNGNWVYTPEEL